MNNQDPSRGLFLQEEEEEENDNPQERGGTDSGIPSVSELTGLYLQHAASSSFGCCSTTETPSASAQHMYYNLMSASFEPPSSTVPVQKMASPCTNRGESSGTARKYEQFQESNEDGPFEDINLSGECRKQKKTHSAEVHNLTERLRRQRLKEKIKCLQELIPNCSKRDKASTLDDAIKYIKNLQYQLQMMSTGQSFTTMHSPWILQSSGHHQGMQIPTLPQFLQTGPRTEIGLGDGIGMSGLSSSINLSVSSNLALPSPNSSASNAPRLPMLGGISEALSIPTPNVFESLPLTTSSCTNFEPFSGTSFPLQVLTSPEDDSPERRLHSQKIPSLHGDDSRATWRGQWPASCADSSQQPIHRLLHTRIIQRVTKIIGSKT